MNVRPRPRATTARLRGIADDALLEHATAAGFVVVTENVVDFVAIAARGPPRGASMQGSCSLIEAVRPSDAHR